MVETPTSNSWLNHYPINPFEENNKFRLEQSILSPNLFNATNNLLTPEKDTNSIWNIDERAILFPADIPTDEKSLIAQFIHDSNLNRQVSAAVETFWSQNKTIIESPAPSSSASSIYKEKIKTSNINKIAKTEIIATNNVEIHETTFINKTTKNQTCQTVLSFPFDLDLSKISALRNFLNEPLNKKNKNNKKKNNISSHLSIRKNLLDYYNSNEDSDNFTDNDDHKIIKSDSPNSLNSIEWNEPKYQERFSSPKFKFPSLNEIEICSTPEISPRNQKDNEFLKFDTYKNLSLTNQIDDNNNNDNNDNNIRKLNFSFDTNNHHDNSLIIKTTPTKSVSYNNLLKTTHNNHDILINSPNLSPIKENSLNNLSVNDEEQNNKNNDNNNNININESMLKNNKKSIIDMDIDIGGILKVQVLQRSDTSSNNTNTNESKNIENFSFIIDNNTTSKMFNKELNNNDTCMNTSKPLQLTNVFDNEDTGYQTNGSTQFNMMDSTNFQESISNFNSQHQLKTEIPEEQKEQQIKEENMQKQEIKCKKLSHPTSLNFNSIKMTTTVKNNNKQSFQPITNSFNNNNETPSTLNIPSFVGLYPLGSSTPEKSKPYFILNNESFNNDTDYLSVTNGLNTNTFYKHNTTFNNNNNNNQDKEVLLKKTAFELNNSFMEQSILNSKLSPSEYARTLIQRALQDLNDSRNINY